MSKEDIVLLLLSNFTLHEDKAQEFLRLLNEGYSFEETYEIVTSQ